MIFQHRGISLSLRRDSSFGGGESEQLKELSLSNALGTDTGKFV
jgi:hypothetical protein